MAVQATSSRKTLPLVLGLAVAGWLIVAACGLWIEWGTQQRAKLADVLADRALAANDANGVAAIRQLERLGLPAVEPLVRLAASQRSEIAAVARQAVGRLLTSWEIAATETSDAAALAERLERLATGLSAGGDQFGAESQRWAKRLARRMAHHCDQLPAKDAWAILLHCERVLSRPTLAATPSPLSIEPTAASDESPESTAAGLLSAIVPSPVENNQSTSHVVESPAAQAGARADLSLVASPSVVARRLPELVDNPLRPPLRLPMKPGEHSPAKRTAVQGEQITTSVRPSTGLAVDVPSPQDVRLLARRLRELSDRQLMERVDSVERAKAAAARQALRERGYSDAMIDMTRRLEASPASERRAALEQASRLSPVEARRLLRWFVADPDAEVRLQALTMLATTGDPKLAELARERAVEDADPRVAALAGELIRGQ